MKAPISWLKEYVDIDVDIETLKNKLFSCGFEVEEIIYQGEEIDRVVCAQILEMEKHPNADKLKICKVDAGEYGHNLQIVTGANNVKTGDKIALALDGAKLPDGKNIATGELRGIVSMGMMCGGSELGLSDVDFEGASIDGVLLLNNTSAFLGESIKDIVGLNDVIFDIGVTANRPDCQSILGMAREVASVLNKPLKMPSLDYKTTKCINILKDVKVEARDLCPRYMAQSVCDIKIEPSPKWMQKRLRSMGIRPINNIVDITNFILLEIGQPMHAFDLENLKGRVIDVRRAFEDEKIITLDEKVFTLSTNNLVICDAENPVALAGIMGGLNSEIKNDTKNIVFESAKFARDNIRKSSRSLGQRTEASARYEKGIDAYTNEIALNRALNLIYTLKCGNINDERFDINSEKLENKIIKTSRAQINGVLGIEIEMDTIKEILQRLYFEVQSDGDNLEIKAPLYREDIDDYPDICEEVIRVYGYDNICPTLLKNASVLNGGFNRSQNNLALTKKILVSEGLNEIITYSFISEKSFDKINLNNDLPNNKFIKIINPLGEDLSVMRTTLIPSLLNAISLNLKRKNLDGRFFEIANVYLAEELPIVTLPKELQMLSIGIFGENEDFYTLKGIIEELATNLNIEFKFEKGALAYYHPTRSCSLKLNGEIVGYMGEVHPNVAEKFEIDKKLYVSELNYEMIEKALGAKFQFKLIPRFPAIERDLALLIDNEITNEEIMNIIKTSGGEFLEEVKLFDLYQGDQIAKDKKSMAYSLLFRCPSKTLTDNEIDESIQNILSNLKEKKGAELRF